MSTLQERLETATAQVEADSTALHNIVHGDSTTTVTTDGGPVKSVAKLEADIQADLEANTVVSQATGARDKAEQWAEETEDTEVETGQYSALHHAAKAAASAAQVQAIADAGAVKVSPDDTTAGDLEGKLLAGDGIAMSTQNDGAAETRTVVVDPGEGLQLIGGKVALDIDGLTTEITDVAVGDKIPVYDTGGSVVGWVSAANFLSVVNNLTEETGIDPAADWLLFSDVSSGASRKIHPNAFVPIVEWDEVASGVVNSQTELEITGLDAGYNYKMVCHEATMASGMIHMTLSTDGGTTYRTSGYQQLIETGSITFGSTSSNGMVGHYYEDAVFGFELEDPAASSKKTHWTFWGFSHRSTTYGYSVSGGGWVNAAEGHAAFKLDAGGASFSLRYKLYKQGIAS